MNAVTGSAHHKIWRIAGPMILANISVPLLGLVDTAILGHLESPRYLGAVAVGASLLSMLYWGFGFLRMGTTGASAQAFGQRDPEEQTRVMVQSATLGLTLAAALLLLGPVLLPLGIGLMNTPPESTELALTYTQIRLFSAPAVLFNYAAIGWLLGQQRARWALVITVATNALNILLDLWLILGLGLNSDGAAIATVVSEYCGALIAVVAVAPVLRRHPLREALTALIRDRRYRAFLAANVSLFIRTAALLFGFAFFTAQGAAFGTTVLAANAILLQLILFASHALDGFAHAAEALVGEAAGRRDWRAFKAMCWRCTQWSLGTALVLTAVLWIGRDLILTLMTDLETVRQTAARFYPWLLVMPLVSMASYLFDGIFIGALQTRWMQHTMLLSLFGVYLPLWWLTRDLDNHGLWLAFVVFNLVRGISLGAAFVHLSQQRSWW